MSLSSLPKPATLEAVLRFRQQELRDFAKAYFGEGYINRVSERSGCASMTTGAAFRSKSPCGNCHTLNRIEAALRELGFVSSLDQPTFQRLAIPRLSNRDSTKVSPERMRRMGYRNAVLPGPDVVVVQRLGQS
jgi:hypothetical protein